MPPPDSDRSESKSHFELDRAAVDAVVERARPIASQLIASGHRVYVVGGLVRDLHLGGGPSTDIDMTTDAEPAQIKAAVAPVADDVWSQGERFGTIGCRRHGVDFEITTHRSDAYDPDSRKPVVSFSTAISSDLSRRDFTVNAMAIDVETGELVDPFHGAADLDRRVLRTPVDPRISFSDDPLRVLRAARFIARYGLVPDDQLIDAAAALAHRLEIVSDERVRDEFEKLLAAEAPGEGIVFLYRVGALGRVADVASAEAAGELAEAIDAVGEVEDGGPAQRTLARRAAFMALALGTRSRVEVEQRLHSLRYSKAEQRRTARVIEALELLEAAEAIDDPLARRVASIAGTDWPAVVGSGFVVATPERAEVLRRSLLRLGESEDLTQLRPELSGDQVMKILGLVGGAEVGEAMAVLLEWRLDEGEHEQGELAERLVSWFAARRSKSGESN